MDPENNYYSDFSFTDVPSQISQVGSYAIPSYGNDDVSSYNQTSTALPEITMYGNQGSPGVQLFDANTIKGADRTYQQQYGNTGRAFYDQTPEGYKQKSDIDAQAKSDALDRAWSDKIGDYWYFKPEREKVAREERIGRESAATDAYVRSQNAAIDRALLQGNQQRGSQGRQGGSALPQQPQATKSNDYFKKRQDLLEAYYNSLQTPTVSKVTGKDIYANMDLTPVHEVRSAATEAGNKTSGLPVAVQRLLKRSIYSGMGEGMRKAWSGAYSAGANLATQNKNIDHQNAAAAANKNNSLRSALSQDRLDALDYGIYEY